MGCGASTDGGGGGGGGVHLRENTFANQEGCSETIAEARERARLAAVRLGAGAGAGPRRVLKVERRRGSGLRARALLRALAPGDELAILTHAQPGPGP